MAMIDGKVVDPRIKVGEVHDDKIITFRACPMLGGGKEKDKDVKKILTDQLLSRGVPDDKIVSRVDGFLSRLHRTRSGRILVKHGLSNGLVLSNWPMKRGFVWSPLMNFVLFQTRKKSDKLGEVTSNVSTSVSTAGSSITSKGSGGGQIKKLDLGEIRVDLSYFKAGGEGVQLISVEAFGPDSRGVAVMHTDSALKYLPIKRLSADPLAIIAIGGKQISDMPIKMAPAANGKGEPILVPMSILNFGDTPVSLLKGLWRLIWRLKKPLSLNSPSIGMK